MKGHLLSCSLLLALLALTAGEVEAASFTTSQSTPAARELSAFPTPVVPVPGKAVTDSSTTAVTFRFAVDTAGNLKYLLNSSPLATTESVTIGQEVSRTLAHSQLRNAENTFTAEFRVSGDGAAEATTTYTVYVDNVVPQAPQDIGADGGDGALLVTWGVPPKPEGFEVFDSFIVSYSTQPFDGMDNETAKQQPTTRVSAINSGRFEARISGLENGRTYHVTVRSVDWVDNVSDFPRDGDAILAVAAQPVTTVTMADLAGENGGCFIATAAYGSYQAPLVQVLRDFRDQVLLTNTPGQAFVSWYYRTSPPWAQRLAAHDGIRAVVRVLLLPLIGFAWLTLNPGSAALLLAGAGLGGSAWWYRRNGMLKESNG